MVTPDTTNVTKLHVGCSIDCTDIPYADRGMSRIYIVFGAKYHNVRRLVVYSFSACGTILLYHQITDRVLNSPGHLHRDNMRRKVA